MERSLTVLLPVHEVESTLASTVLEILEVVSELTERFELVIVDDGSADATSEVADELTRHYPQVHTVRHGRSLGREAAVCTGLKRSSGEIIFVPDETGGSPVDGIPKLWHAADRQERAPDDPQRTPDEPQRTPDEPQRTTADRWTRLSTGHQLPRPGYQMFLRREIEQLHGSSQPKRPNYLARLRNFALGE